MLISELAEVPEAEEDSTSTSQPKVEEKKERASPSPAGVNRRTAVLFSKKARKHEQNAAAKSTPVSSRRGKGSAVNTKKDKEEKEEEGTDIPATPASRKRAASAASIEPEAPAPKRAAVDTETADSPAPFVPPPKESFTTYRNLGQQYESEIDSTSECGSTATSATATDSTSEDFSEDGTPKAAGGSSSKKKGIGIVIACVFALS